MTSHTSLLQGYLQQLETDPAKTAFILDAQSFTYAELDARVAFLRQTFAEKKHLRVAIALRNCLDVACWYIACVHSRHTLILMDPEWPQATQAAALQLVQPDIFVSGEDGAIDHGYCHSNNSGSTNSCSPDTRTPNNPDWFSESNFAFLAGFTSGSSGQPKAFLRYSDSWLASFKCSAREFGVTTSTVQLAPGPLSHGLSFYTMAESLHAGATFMTRTVFDAACCVGALHSRTNPVNNLVVVPTMLQRMLDVTADCENTLRQKDGIAGPLKFRAIVAGAKLSSHLKQRFRATWPSASLSEYYGASELSFISVNHDHERIPDNSVGRLCEGVSITNFGDSGEVIEGPKTGTLHVRSPMLACGYLQRQQAGLATVPLRGREGWSTVGDRGWLDNKNLYLTDREDRMLISGGLNVYPSSVERVIADALHNSGFAESVEHYLVCGIADEEWGEQIVLVLAGPGLYRQLSAESTAGSAVEGAADAASFKKIIADCFVQSLQKHEIPRRLFIAETVPMTPSGKVAYRELQYILPGLCEIQI